MPRRSPLWKTVDHAPRSSPVGTKQFDGTIGVDAVRPATVGHVLLPLRELLQASLEIVDRHRNRARNMAGQVLARWPGVENHDLLRPSALEQVRHRYAFGVGPIAKMLLNQSFEFREAALSDGSEGLRELEYLGAGQRVMHEQHVRSAGH